MIPIKANRAFQSLRFIWMCHPILWMAATWEQCGHPSPPPPLLQHSSTSAPCMPSLPRSSLSTVSFSKIRYISGWVGNYSCGNYCANTKLNEWVKKPVSFSYSVADAHTAWMSPKVFESSLALTGALYVMMWHYLSRPLTSNQTIDAIPQCGQGLEPSTIYGLTCLSEERTLLRSSGGRQIP